MRYQREADAAAATQLQTEVARIREVEVGKIRLEERGAARDEVERVLVEQQRWHAKQVAAMRKREGEAAEALRKREAAFESSCYEHRQRMLTELESVRSREAQLAAEAGAAQKSLAAEGSRARGAIPRAAPP